MDTIENIFKTARREGRQPVSFEIFPPKGDLTLNAAREVESSLSELAPDFISVTYSAGGSGNKRATSDIVSMIECDYGVPSVAHLTCAGSSEEDVVRAVAELSGKGVRNVLALRGDLPADGSRAEAADGPYVFAKDLIERLAQEGFCIGAAAYPEGHIACEDARANIEHLKQKQDAGASFFVTQLFFDNEYFYRFWDDALNAGITVPITCGIMPFLSKAQIQRMVFMCGASLPSPIIKLLARYEDSPEDLRRAGIEYACDQLVGLSEHGVDGLHVYTMNHPDIAQASVEALRAAWGR